MQKYSRDFSLDFVRATAILLIIFFHYNCETVRIVSNELNLFRYYGYSGLIGVSMFFIVSGASLGLSTRNQYSLSHFYKKRFMAIFPLFWTIYFLIVLVQTIVFQMNLFVGRNPLTFFLTIIGVDGFLLYKIPNYYRIGEWFLGCIIIIYAVFPFVRYLFYKNKYALLTILIAICVLLEKFYNFDMLLPRFPLFRLFEFVFGLYFVTAYKSNSHKTNCILLLISAIFIYTYFAFRFSGNLIVTHILLGMFSFIFLTTLSRISEKYFPKKIIVFLSKYSFAAFLFHHVILVNVVKISKNIIMLPYYNITIFIGTVVVVYLLSFLVQVSFRYLMRNTIPVL